MPTQMAPESRKLQPLNRLKLVIGTNAVVLFGRTGLVASTAVSNPEIGIKQTPASGGFGVDIC